MRHKRYVALALVTLGISSCRPAYQTDAERARRERERRDQDSAAYKAGQKAHQLADEAEKAAEDARRKIREGARKAREGWRDGGKQPPPKTPENDR